VATVTLEVGETVRGRAEAGFTREADAKDGEKAITAAMALAELSLPTLTKELKKNPMENAPLLQLVDLGGDALKDAKVSRTGTLLRVEASAKADLAALSSAIEATSQKTRRAAQRATSQNNLKQLALAMHNYHDTNGVFPPVAVYDKAGKPLLSWRVLILPYIEQDNLYQKFRLDEPWDSDHNKKLLAQVPPVYRHPAAKRGTDTHYRVFTGRGTLFEGKRGVQITKIADGTSNTLMFVEAAEGVPWSKPDDLPDDPAKPLPKLGGFFPDGFNAAFCDGSVHFLRATINEKTMRALITIAGGEVIDFKDL
jgi:prepilin-type processing-associated H-X9-DG protein